MQEINTGFEAEAESVKSRLLLQAIRKNKLAWVRCFILNGESLANISAANNVDPLHLAILYNHQEIILLLLHVGLVFGLFSKPGSSLATLEISHDHQEFELYAKDAFKDFFSRFSLFFRQINSA